MTSAAAALERLCDPDFEVAAHYLIGGDGRLWQMVAEDQRAWHAGVGEWAGMGDVNSRSIGIELDNRGDHPFSHRQMATLEDLLPQIMQRWAIPPEGVIGHSDMAPGRKIDPGRHFDWARLAAQGLAASAQNEAVERVSIAAFRAAAQRAGFTAKSDDATLLQAVRLRYRPWATGVLTAQDIACLPR